MKAPKCWTCGGRHWSTQPCGARYENTVTKRPNNVTPVTKGVMPVDAGRLQYEPQLDTVGGGRGKGRPRKHMSNAERQRAYRERSK